MAAYVILTVDVVDESALAAYRERAPQMAQEYGGRLLGRGDVVEVAGGEMPQNRRRIVVFEFENLDRAREWHTLPKPTPEHAEIRELRSRAGEVTTTFVDGNL